MLHAVIVVFSFSFSYILKTYLMKVRTSIFRKTRYTSHSDSQSLDLLSYHCRVLDTSKFS